MIFTPCDLRGETLNTNGAAVQKPDHPPMAKRYFKMTGLDVLPLNALIFCKYEQIFKINLIIL